MSKLLLLLKINVLGTIRGRGKKSKKITRTLLLLIGAFAICYYSYRFANLSMKGYKVLNSQYVLLPEYFAIISIFIIMSNYKKINTLFFKNKDYDILCSMPIKRKYIVISKFLDIYAVALGVTLIVMLPAYIVYINNVSVNILFHIRFFITMLFVPLIPTIISILIGYVISFISTFFKRKDIVQLIISIMFFMIGYKIGNNLSNMSPEEFASIGKVILRIFNKFYPITILYKEIIIDENILSMIFYLFINILFLIPSIFIITKSFEYINGKLNHVSSSRNKKIKYAKNKGIYRAMLKKDYKRLIGCVNYVLNSCIGVLLTGFILAGLITANPNSATSLLSVTTQVGKYMLPFMIIMMIGFIYPSCVSLSLEGKNFYILRVLPISFKKIIKEKILFQLSISGPVAIASIIVLVIKMDTNLFTSVLIALAIILCSVLYVLLHIFLDIAFLKLHWENEIKVVKQSIQSILSVAAAIALGIVPISLVKNSARMILYLSIVLALIITVYLLLITFGNKKFEKTCD